MLCCMCTLPVCPYVGLEGMVMMVLELLDGDIRVALTVTTDEGDIIASEEEGLFLLPDGAKLRGNVNQGDGWAEINTTLRAGSDEGGLTPVCRAIEEVLHPGCRD